MNHIVERKLTKLDDGNAVTWLTDIVAAPHTTELTTIRH